MTLNGHLLRRWWIVPTVIFVVASHLIVPRVDEVGIVDGRCFRGRTANRGEASGHRCDAFWRHPRQVSATTALGAIDASR
jgi:hypothetical protein